MRVLLVSANRELKPFPVFPLGVAYLRAALEQRCHEVRVLDCCFNESIDQSVKEILDDFSPEFIGVSIRNIDNLTYCHEVSYLPDIKKLIQYIQDNTAIPLLLGGSGFSLMPERVLDYCEVDYGVVGEGENAIVDFAEYVVGRREITKVSNLVWWSGETKEYRHNSSSRSDQLLDMLPPSRRGFDISFYLNEGGMINVQTQRGCCFDCIYCDYPIVNGRTIRLRSPRSVVDEIAALQEEYAVDYIFLADDIFNAVPEHAKAVCHEMLERKININWSCFLSPRGFDEEFAELLAASGCVAAEFGIDSCSRVILENLRKPFSLDDISMAIRTCRNAGIRLASYIVFGAPGETESTVRETFSFIDQTGFDVVIALVGIRIYPGTVLQKEYMEQSDNEVNLLMPHFYISPEISPKRLLDMIQEHTGSRRKWIVPNLQINTENDFIPHLRELGKRGPLWDML